MPAHTLERILVVEDEPDIREIVRLSLETVGGFAVQVCRSGEEAIAASADARPDLILLDVMMPGLDGPSTLARLRAIPAVADVPVIFMTAKAQRHEVERFLALGAAEVIAKPFDPMTLADKIRSVWARIPG